MGGQVLSVSQFVRSLIAKVTTAFLRMLGVRPSFTVGLDANGAVMTCGPAATPAQNLAAYNAAKALAVAAGGGDIIFDQSGNWKFPNAGADPHDAEADHCLVLPSYVRIRATVPGVSLMPGTNALTVTPSVRSLNFITSKDSTEIGIGTLDDPKLWIDGNWSAQNGHTDFAQGGKTNGLLVYSTFAGGGIHRPKIINVGFRSWFGNPFDFKRPPSLEVNVNRDFYTAHCTFHECGEGPQIQGFLGSTWINPRVYDDGLDFGEGVVAVTEGDALEDVYGADTLILGGGCFLGEGLTPASAGAALDIDNDKVTVVGFRSRWPKGFQGGFEGIRGAVDVTLDGCDFDCIDAGLSGTYGIEVYPGTRATNCTVRNAQHPIITTQGWYGTPATLDFANLTIIDSGNCFIAQAAKMRGTNLQIIGGTEIGIRLYHTPGRDFPTLELNGGKISCVGPAIKSDGGGSDPGTGFHPYGFVTNIDASGANAGAWPFPEENYGSFKNITFTNNYPKDSTDVASFSGAEKLTYNNSMTHIDFGGTGSKDQVLILQYGSPPSPRTDVQSASGTWGSTDAGLAKRIIVQDGTTVLGNGDQLVVKHQSDLTWLEIERRYVHIGNRPIHVSFSSTAVIVPGTTVKANPTIFRVTRTCILRRLSLSMTPFGAFRTAGTLTANFYTTGYLVASLVIDGTNNQQHIVTYGRTNRIEAGLLLDVDFVASGDFATTLGMGYAALHAELEV